MSRRRYAEVAEEIERLKEIAEEYAEDDRPDPLTPDEKAALNELFDVDPWDENAETEAAVRGLHDAYGEV
jgi:hypothetical protein